MEDDRPGKVFVGGLSFELDEDEFEKAFSKFGKITEVLLKRDQQTNKSRGFGFITFENPADAEAAVDAMDQTEVKGKMIHVDQAVKPGGRDGDRGGRGGFRGRGSSRGFIDRGRGGFRGSRGGGFRGSTRGSFRGSFRGDRGRGDRGGRGGRGSFRDRDDDRRGPPRRSSFDRSFGDRDRGPPRRDDDRDRFGSSSLDRGDRYRSDPSDSRRGPDPYRPSPPRGVDRNGTILSPKTSRNATKDGNFRDYGGGLGSRDYSPPPRDSFRDRGISRDYGSSRDVGISSLSRTYDTGRDSFSSRDPYRRDDYVAPARDSRDYGISRDPPSRDYLPPRDSARPITRDFDRGLPPPRDSYDSYRDRSSGIPSRGYGGSPPRRSPPPPRSYSPLGMDRGRDLDRDRGRGGDYSPGSRRPAPYDSRGPPPPKRSRPDDGPPLRGPPRDGPPRGMSRDGPLRDSPRGPPRDGLSSRGPPRGPPRDGPRDSGRGGPPPFRR